MRRGKSIVLVIVTAAMVVSALGKTAFSEGKRPWTPKLYGFCMDMPAVKNPSVPDHARMLREIGFDGAGYALWLGDELDRNLRILDEAGLGVYMLYVPVNVNPAKRPFDSRVPSAMRKLKGRPVTICVQLRGFRPGDPRGLEPAVKILRRLGDLAAESDLRISIYHHVGDWTESLLHALEVVEKANHPRVGANFNLCHWLKVDGDKDYRSVLRRHGGKIFVVTINGAKLGAETWTNGLIQPLDKGDFDNRELLALLRETGYRGPVGLMCYGIPDEAGEHLTRSMNVWKRWQVQWAED